MMTIPERAKHVPAIKVIVLDYLQFHKEKQLRVPVGRTNLAEVITDIVVDALEVLRQEGRVNEQPNADGAEPYYVLVPQKPAPKQPSLLDALA